MYSSVDFMDCLDLWLPGSVHGEKLERTCVQIPPPPLNRKEEEEQ